jgi:putative transposase
VQTCIVHQIRASLRYVNYRDKRAVAKNLRPVYTAANADDAMVELERFDQAWGARYPMIAQAWRRDWEYITPFLSLPEDLRRVVYTTNTIEAMHRQIRKAIKTRGHFPDEQAATKLIYLAIERAETKWRSVRAWTAGLAALKIHFGVPPLSWTPDGWAIWSGREDACRCRRSRRIRWSSVARRSGCCARVAGRCRSSRVSWAARRSR